MHFPTSCGCQDGWPKKNYGLLLKWPIVLSGSKQILQWLDPYTHMGGSMGVLQKLMVFNGTSHLNGWWNGVPGHPFQETSISLNNPWYSMVHRRFSHWVWDVPPRASPRPQVLASMRWEMIFPNETSGISHGQVWLPEGISCKWPCRENDAWLVD